MKEHPYVFIVGSPRSGTTILAEVLDAHPRIAQWYEPYFIWDHFFRDAIDDVRTEEEATEDICGWIRRYFERYRKARNVELVVDKSPRNCLKLDFIRAVFPKARFVFILREGRDTIVSIRREWLKRQSIIEDAREKREWTDVLQVVRGWLKRQPFWKLRLNAFLFELGSPSQWVRGGFLHRQRWNGRVGWGPRFREWERWIDQLSILEFNALQWVHCVDGIIPHLESLSQEKRFIIRYEDFTENPREELGRLFSFLDVEFPEDLMERIPVIRSGNFHKWRRELSQEEIGAIGPMISETLIKLGYEHDDSWYRSKAR